MTYSNAKVIFTQNRNQFVEKYTVNKYWALDCFKDF